MARYTGSRTKLSKRIGRNLFLKGARNFSAKDDFSKHPFKTPKSGVGRTRPAKVSEYGKQLLEKQAIRFTYGIMEKQLMLVFKKAFKKSGDTGKNALTSLERRLDNVVFRGGLANSRVQARQLVTHGHFLINGKKATIPSMQVEAGDEVTIKATKTPKPFWQNFTLQVPGKVPSWIDNSKKQTIKVISLPLDEDLPQDFKIGSVVELYSRVVG
jgi:small subunit ribosomal protein S4